MTTILRFIILFLLAPVFAVVAQTAGSVQADFRVVDTGFQSESVVQEGTAGSICNYDSSGALLQQRNSLDGKGDDGYGPIQLEEFEFPGAELSVFAFLSEFNAANKLPTPNLRTGAGYDAGDVPVRIDGDWSINDMKQALLGHPPRGLGSPDIHHGGQMPGGALHEVLPQLHRNNPALHPNKFNQGVTPEMRASDRQLHWWYRAREQGADELLPNWIYD